MWDQQSLRSVCAYAQSDQRSKGQTVSFSESSHVAYQIKADDAGSNMVAQTHPRPLGWGQKVKPIFRHGI